ncbi:MAG TPA: methyltransferase domain-containing protein [Candidatus Dormibacteraeota bacterium]|nr:methyltransferase domain-containing protein [Candidatus Dormibacteraeota bacterium]
MSESPPSYDQLWRGYWGDMQRFGPVHRHIREDLMRRVLALDVHSVLDVGCGSGENLAALAAAGRFQLSGVDISGEGIELARRRVPSASFSVLDVSREVLPHRFDLVMSIQVVEHIPDDASALRNIARMSRRYVFVSTIGGRMRRSETTTGHVRNYTRAELKRKLEAAGLLVLEVTGWGFPFYSPLYRSAVEYLPGGPPAGPAGRVSRFAGNVLYELYRLNWRGRGDVLSALAETTSTA